MSTIHRGTKMRSILLSMLLVASQIGSLDAQVVRGQVVDSITQVPLPGARLVLLDHDDAEVGRTVTDEAGLFLVRATTSGEYRLRVEFDGYQTSTFPHFTLEQDEMKGFMLLVTPTTPSEASLTDQDIVDRVCVEGTVQPGEGVLLGLVRNASSREPVAGAEVFMSWPAMEGPLAQLAGGDILEDYVAVVTSSVDGLYVACGVPNGASITFGARHVDLLSDVFGVRFAQGGVFSDDVFHPSIVGVWRQDLNMRSPNELTGEIAGQVTDMDARPVADATVEVLNLSRQTTTGVDGRFSFTDLPAGPIQLVVRRIGFRHRSHRIDLATDERVALKGNALRLETVPAELDPVIVETDRPVSRRPLADFYERRERGGGAFITRSEFEERGAPQEATQVLRRMRGIRVRANRNYRDTGQRWIVTMTGGFRQSCPPLYFLDRLYIGNARDTNIDHVLPLINVEAIEAYGSVGAIPPEFNRRGAQCGVIAFWTR